jgi:hypothetical protein
MSTNRNRDECAGSRTVKIARHHFRLVPDMAAVNAFKVIDVARRL